MPVPKIYFNRGHKKHEAKCFCCDSHAKMTEPKPSEETRGPILVPVLLGLSRGGVLRVAVCSHCRVHTLLRGLARLPLHSFHFSCGEIQRCVVHFLCVTILQIIILY